MDPMRRELVYSDDEDQGVATKPSNANKAAANSAVAAATTTAAAPTTKPETKATKGKDKENYDRSNVLRRQQNGDADGDENGIQVAVDEDEDPERESMLKKIKAQLEKMISPPPHLRNMNPVKKSFVTTAFGMDRKPVPTMNMSISDNAASMPQQRALLADLSSTQPQAQPQAPLFSTSDPVQLPSMSVGGTKIVVHDQNPQNGIEKEVMQPDPGIIKPVFASEDKVTSVATWALPSTATMLTPLQQQTPLSEVRVRQARVQFQPDILVSPRPSASKPVRRKPTSLWGRVRKHMPKIKLETREQLERVLIILALVFTGVLMVSAALYFLIPLARGSADHMADTVKLVDEALHSSKARVDDALHSSKKHVDEAMHSSKEQVEKVLHSKKVKEIRSTVLHPRKTLGERIDKQRWRNMAVKTGKVAHTVFVTPFILVCDFAVSIKNVLFLGVYETGSSFIYGIRDLVSDIGKFIHACWSEMESLFVSAIRAISKARNRIIIQLRHGLSILTSKTKFAVNRALIKARRLWYWIDEVFTLVVQSIENWMFSLEQRFFGMVRRVAQRWSRSWKDAIHAFDDDAMVKSRTSEDLEMDVELYGKIADQKLLELEQRVKRMIEEETRQSAHEILSKTFPSRAANPSTPAEEHIGMAEESVDADLDLDRVAEQIMEKLVADKGARPDYALLSAGSYVISSSPSRPSQVLQFVTSRVSGLLGTSQMILPLGGYAPSGSSTSSPSSNSHVVYRPVLPHPPWIALTPDVSPGNCWAFRGHHANLTIHLARPIYIDSVTLEHTPKTSAFHSKSAPSHFAVYGIPCSGTGTANHEVFLGRFQYLVDDGVKHIQTFGVETSSSSFQPAVSCGVRLEVLSNHGSEQYTCLYRFRVHGTEPERGH